MSINKILILDASLVGILAFLLIFWILSFLNIPLLNPYYALVPAAVVFIAVLIRKFRTNKILEIEKRYPSMDEALRTASDNANRNNQVVRDLQAEILTQLRSVEVAAFAEPRTIYVQTVLIGLLCFAIVFSAPLSVTFTHAAGGILDKIPKTLNLGHNTDSPDPENDGQKPFFSNMGTAVTDALFGQPSVAKIGDKELEAQLTPQGTELDVRNVQDVQGRDFTDTLPNEVYARASEAYEENIQKDEQELIKNYFEKIADNP